MVENIRKKIRGKKRTTQKTEASTMAVSSVLKQPAEKLPRGTQVKRDGLVITVERRGISSGIALRHLSCSQLQVPSAKDHTGEETALLGVGPRDRTLKTIWTEASGSSPHKLLS